MRDRNRIFPTIEKIKKYWLKHPDQRLTQVILNIVKFGMQRDFACPQVYHVEDDDLMEGLERMEKLQELSRKENRTVDASEKVII